jgi:hypothetical protein
MNSETILVDRVAVIGYAVIEGKKRNKRGEEYSVISLEPLLMDNENCVDCQHAIHGRVIGVLPAAPGTYGIRRERGTPTPDGGHDHLYTICEDFVIPGLPRPENDPGDPGPHPIVAALLEIQGEEAREGSHGQ